MSDAAEITVRLSPEQRAFIEQKIAEGWFDSVEDAVDHAVDWMMDWDRDLEPLALTDDDLRAAVLPALRAHETDPSAAKPMDEVFDRLERKLLAKVRAAE